MINKSKLVLYQRKLPPGFNTGDLMNETSDVAVQVPEGQNTEISVSSNTRCNCEICFQNMSNEKCFTLGIIWLILFVGTIVGLLLTWLVLGASIFGTWT